MPVSINNKTVFPINYVPVNKWELSKHCIFPVNGVATSKVSFHPLVLTTI